VITEAVAGESAALPELWPVLNPELMVASGPASDEPDPDVSPNVADAAPAPDADAGSLPDAPAAV
jgi:hypothetical protein